MTTRPSYLVLQPPECQSLLEHNHVGRLAFLRAGTVDIEPIGYVATGPWIFFRSAYGAKLEALAHHPYAAFEVDEVAGPMDWRSVVAHGTVYVLAPDGATVERQTLARAVESLRQVAPEAFTSDDPTPQRSIVYGLHVDRMSGRMAQPTSAPRRGRKRQPVRPASKRRRAIDGS